MFLSCLQSKGKMMTHLSQQNWIYASAPGVSEALHALAEAILGYDLPPGYWLHEFDTDGVVTLTLDPNTGDYTAGCCVSYAK